MKKKFNKPVSGVLVAVFMGSVLTGCTTSSIIETGSVVDDMESEIPAIYEDVSITTTSTLSFFENYLEVLREKYKDINVDDVLENPYDYSMEEGAVAGYINLQRKNISISSIEEELHRLLLFAQVPRCCTEEEFNYAVGTLKTTLNYTQNPFTSYLPLAEIYHLCNCKDEHFNNEFGILSCDSLNKEYNEVFSTPSFEEILDGIIIDPLYFNIKEYIKTHPEVSMNDIINELEAIISFRVLNDINLNESDISKIFNILKELTPDGSDLFETYTPLSIMIHNALVSEDEKIDPSNELVRNKPKIDA